MTTSSADSAERRRIAGWHSLAPDVMLGGCIQLMARIGPVPKEERGKESLSFTIRLAKVSVSHAEGESSQEFALMGVLEASNGRKRTRVDMLSPLTFRAGTEPPDTDEDELLRALGTWGRHVMWDYAANQARQLSAANLAQIDLPSHTPEVRLRMRDGSHEYVSQVTPADYREQW